MAGLLLGTSIAGRGAAAARERSAQLSLAALQAAGVAQCVNLAFADETASAGECETLRVLRQDARTVSGVEGPRKPLVPEMLDALAAEAVRRGLDRVGIVNGDIRVTSAAAEKA